MLPTHSISQAGGEDTASPCRKDKVRTVGIGAYKGSETIEDWLLTAVTDGRRG